MRIHRWGLAALISLVTSLPVSATPAKGPFEFACSAAGNNATVTVTFLSDMTDAEVDVWGVAGLALTSSSALMTHAAVHAGETHTFQVAVIPRVSGSYLGVRASGTVHGQRGVSVTSVPFGTPAQRSATVTRNGQKMLLRGATPTPLPALPAPGPLIPAVTQ